MNDINGCTNGINYKLDENLINYYSPEHLPVILLYGAMLQRALWDLQSHAPYRFRRDAILWFTRNYNGSNNEYIKFEDVKDLLNLNEKHLTYIKYRVDYAIKLNRRILKSVREEDALEGEIGKNIFSYGEEIKTQGVEKRA